jgi:LacI family transcriptional regulator
MSDRPTTRDVARAAGVSLATVDRVLNGRAGVRARTVENVQDAIQRIGFERDPFAAALARRRARRIVVALPEAGDLFLAALTDHIAQSAAALAAERLDLDILRLPDDPHRAADILMDLRPDRLDGLALWAPATPPLRDAARHLRATGVHVAAIVADQRGETPFVGVDDRAAGRTAGALMGRFARERAGAVLVVADSLLSSDATLRRLGFDEVMARHPSLRAGPTIETRGDPDRVATALRRVLARSPAPVGLYVTSSEARLAMQEADALLPPDAIRIAHERTRFTEAALRDGRLDAVVTQDPGHVIRSAIRTLRAAMEGRSVLPAQERIRIEILLRENL